MSYNSNVKPVINPEGLTMKTPHLTVLFDGGCPLCSREISYYQTLTSLEPIEWVDIDHNDTLLQQFNVQHEAAMAEFHVFDIQSSFAGYFPADNPQYTCVVVIKNKPFAPIFYGASVAGPVFKEIADRLYGTYIKTNKTLIAGTNKKDSSFFAYNGYKADLMYLTEKLKIGFADSTGRADEWTRVNKNSAKAVLQKLPVDKNAMPPLKGLGLKDAIYLCEEMGLMVQVKGRGKVTEQSIVPGQPIAKGQLVQLSLN